MKIYNNVRNVRKKENLDNVIEERERCKRRSSDCLDVGKYKTTTDKLKYLEQIFSGRKIRM
jgi:hypothetical protein